MGVATAGLFETHPMAVQTPTFPPVVLHIPVDFILSQLPHPDNQQVLASRQGSSRKEPIIQLGKIVEAMKPPHCFGVSVPSENGSHRSSPEVPPRPSLLPSEDVGLLRIVEQRAGSDTVPVLDNMIADFGRLKHLFACHESQVSLLFGSLSEFLVSIAQLREGKTKHKSTYVESWVLLKRQGEDTISSVLKYKHEPTVQEWRRFAERLFVYMTQTAPGFVFRNKLSLVLTDYHCNGHVTSTGCFERSVRLPAALRAAKLAGATTDSNGPIKLITEIPQKYAVMVEEKLLVKAHAAAYLKRIKGRCASLTNDSEVAKLTDDSSGEGGQDTCE